MGAHAWARTFSRMNTCTASLHMVCLFCPWMAGAPKITVGGDGLHLLVTLPDRDETYSHTCE
eukprot:3105266-Pyramimonas_sp.AAC.1